MKIAYVRVSSVDQNESRQVESLKVYGIERWFTEKASAKDTKRPQLIEMLDFIREGDTVYIHDFSRIARNTKDLLSIIDHIKNKGAELVSSKEAVDTSTPTGKLMITVIGAINEFEREILLERQREGIRIAKEAGKYRGGQVKRIEGEIFDAAYKRYMNREMNKKQLAKELKISMPTLNKLLKEKGLPSGIR